MQQTDALRSRDRVIVNRDRESAAELFISSHWSIVFDVWRGFWLEPYVPPLCGVFLSSHMCGSVILSLQGERNLTSPYTAAYFQSIGTAEFYAESKKNLDHLSRYYLHT